MPEKWCMDPNGEFRFNHDRPDYLNDLNAMHEAEEKLDCNQWEVWHRIVGEWPTELARLTASQRAEAFLRTIGKWKEAKL